MIQAKEIQYRLDITTTTCLEVRRKLRVGKYITEDDYKRIERFVNDVRRAEGKITLSAINNFLDFHKLEDYWEEQND